MRPAAVGDMPGVDLRLKVVPFRQKRPILRRKVADDPGEALPEHRGGDARPRQRAFLDEGGEFRRDLQSVPFDPHHLSSRSPRSAL